jgi:hypothetical protein
VTRLRLLGLAGATVLAATAFANPARAEPGPTPGIQVNHESGRCTAGFAAEGDDGSYYFITSGHCDEHDDTLWTYGQDFPLGKITVSEKVGEKDAAIIRLDPSVGKPTGDVGGKYRVRNVLSRADIQVGMPFCKIGAVTGETCGAIIAVDCCVVEASVFSLNGDSGSPGFVKNADGTVSAVGILRDSPDGDDYTTYFTLVHPLLSKWGLRILA